MASTSDIRNGMCMEYNNDIYIVTYFQHVKPGKGNAFVRTKLKSVTNGRVVENTFPAGHKINDVRVERRKHQYLYKDDSGFHFMNTETFDQVYIQKEMVDNSHLMKEGENIEILYHAAKEIPLACELPQFIILQVTYVEPGVKGDTATNANTPATVETGATIKVPLFIKEGDFVRIESATGNYIERVKQ